jgi:hypothetical protein
LWLALVCEQLEQWEDGVAALQQMSKLRPEADEWKGLRYRFLETIRKQQAEDEAAEGPPEEEKIDPPPSADNLNADEALEEAAPPQVPPGTPGRKAVPPEKLQESGR